MTDDRSGYLVETDWLNERLEAQSVRVLDVTGMLTSELSNAARERLYDEGHRREQIAHILGDISDEKAAAILRTGATQRDLEEVVVWTAGEDDVMGELKRRLVGIAAEIYEILDEERQRFHRWMMSGCRTG